MRLFRNLLFVTVMTMMIEPAMVRANPEDPYRWLEEIESPKALDWVKSQNERTLKGLKSDPRFVTIEDEMRKIIQAKDRVPFGRYRSGYVYDFWQDETYVRGIWRRTPVEEYKKESPSWEILLDIDKLNKKEGKNWVYKGTQCLPPAFQKCLVTLSPGGQDASVVREFDISRKDFVPDGFFVPEAKSRIAWVDSDTLLVATDFGPGSLTHAGYPSVLKVWKRGQPLTDAQEVFRGQVTDVGLGVASDLSAPTPWFTISRSLTFFEKEVWQWSPAGELKKLPFPNSAQFVGIFHDYALATLRDAWTVGDQTFVQGSLVALRLGRDPSETQLVLEPNSRMSIQSVDWTRDALYINVLENVRSKVIRGAMTGSHWVLQEMDLPSHGIIGIESTDHQSDLVWLTFEDFVTPSTLYSLNFNADSKTARPEILKSSPIRFNSHGLEITQKEAISKDGTRIPYFLIHKNGITRDGSHPTLLYGYGGFELSETPFYLSTWGKVWLEKGGVVAIANIRGGGEFGPAWHQAAVKEKHQTSFDDFIATAENLIQTGFTSPRRLAIMGGSNGGLLVGATYVQRPDLFRAVVCQVPLLDMLRYHQLLAGASWMGEYGNPDIPEERAAIEKYSPYQNLKKDVRYPTVLFTTSTRDDRVHPGHARKMAAKMAEYGHPFEYFENINGGHGGAADQEERILVKSLEFTFLFQQLFD